MTTSELISFIKKQIQNNVSKNLIISKLIGAGWKREDIDEGFSIVESESKPDVILDTTLPEIKDEVKNINPIINSTFKKEVSSDQYREPIESDNITNINKVSQIPKVESTPIKTPEKVELPKKEAPKVWTPMSVPIKGSIKSEVTETKGDNSEIIIQNPELQSKQPDNLPGIKKVDTIIKTPEVNNSQFMDKKEDLIPKLIPKMVTNPFGYTNKNNQTTPNTSFASGRVPQGSAVKDLSKTAMLSSYPNELSMFQNKIQDQVVSKKRSTMLKWLIVVLIIFAIAGAGYFTFTSGYINVKSFNLNLSKFKLNLNFSFIKKDPKTLLLNNSKALASLNSYKTETNIEVSSPSFASISYGLLAGEAINTIDKDSISIKSQGAINNNEQGLLSDDSITIKGSILPTEIITNIKNNGTDLFVSIPDLNEIIKENTLESTVVKINEQQLDLIPSLFPAKIETQLNKINVYKVLAGGISSFVNNETLKAYNDLISNVEITEKGQENIKGIETYHYSINTDRQLAKNLLTKISDNFFHHLSDEDKEKLTQILGSITINSFDVWVGKGDNTIYQYSTVLDIPLSKIIGFDDKSIGNNNISISWKTTYYDFNISNEILIPEISTPIIDLIKKTKETKIKNEVSAFKQITDDFYKVKKNYGVISNTKGDCMNPINGTLFSPLGHSKGKMTAVGSISLFLNNILGMTGGVGACYSTPQAWSFTIPISDNYDTASIPEGGYTSFYCIDSTGAREDLTSLPTGVVCK